MRKFNLNLFFSLVLFVTFIRSVRKRERERIRRRKRESASKEVCKCIFFYCHCGPGHCVCVCVFAFRPRFAWGLRNFELASTFWSRVPFFLAAADAAAAACDIVGLFNEIDRLSKRVDCCCCCLCPDKRSKVSTRKKRHIEWSPCIKWKSFKYPTAPAAAAWYMQHAQHTHPGAYQCFALSTISYPCVCSMINHSHNRSETDEMIWLEPLTVILWFLQRLVLKSYW